MEDNIQTIITIIISAFLLFIFPVYMAYEKKDDVSYALAIRYTQDLVDNVRSKGYISKDMYYDYKARLKVTGNAYDIDMTHEYIRFDPITNYYTKDENDNYIIKQTSTQEERKKYEQTLTNIYTADGEKTDEEIQEYIKEKYEEKGIYKVEDTYVTTTQKYKTNYIESILNSENKLVLASENNTVSCSDDSENYCINAYTMNVGDNFNIKIKNTNTTLATFIYNMITANTLDTNTRIYVNYGGDILSTKWYSKIDYSKMKHDDVHLTKLQVIFSYNNELLFGDETKPVKNIGIDYSGEYTLTFDVKPTETTELKEKGIVQINEIVGYNFALGNNIKNNKNGTLSVSVGINGISLITNNTNVIKVSTDTSFVLPTYNKPVIKTKTVEEEYEYEDEFTGETKIGTRLKTVEYTDYEPTQRVITDYTKIKLQYKSKGKIQVTLTGKSGVRNYTSNLTLLDESDLLNGLSYTLNNPTEGSFTGKLGSNIDYNIIIHETSIEVTAIKYVPKATVILSYPVAIDDYTNIKIEMKQKENNNYTAMLYINSEKVDESIQMSNAPTVNVIGETVFGSNSPIYFKGNIKNVIIYKKQ